MGAMSSIQQLVESIDGHIQELNGEIASLQNARSALTSDGSDRRRSRKSPPRQRARRRTTRTTEVLFADRAERMLADGDGLTTAALATAAGADRDQVLTLLRDLEQAGRVRRTGQRRATRWHAITDEERIRERAAELASRSRRRRTQSTSARAQGDV